MGFGNRFKCDHCVELEVRLNRMKCDNLENDWKESLFLCLPTKFFLLSFESRVFVGWLDGQFSHFRVILWCVIDDNKENEYMMLHIKTNLRTSRHVTVLTKHVID